MKTNWQTLPAAVALSAWMVVSAGAQPEPGSTTTVSIYSTGETTSSPAKFRASRTDYIVQGKGDRSERHRSGRQEKSEEFRRFIQTELAANPALNRRVEKLSEIHARRQALQQKRQAAAEQTTAGREMVVKNFHALLREDLELAESTRRIARDIVKDMPLIEQQLQERRQALAGKLTRADAEDRDSGTTSSVARDLRRRLHYLDFIERKLEGIKTHPERLDLLARMVRGGPPEEGGQARFSERGERSGGKRMQDSGGGPEGTRDLEQLKRRRRMLERELREVESKIENMEETGASGKSGKADR